MTNRPWIGFLINFTVWDANICGDRPKYFEIPKIENTLFYSSQLLRWSLSWPNSKFIRLDMKNLELGNFSLSRSETGTQASSADQDKMVGVEHQFADGLQSFRKPSECTLLSKKNRSSQSISLIWDLSLISSRHPSSETDPDSGFQPNLVGFRSFSLTKKCCIRTLVF